MHYDRISADCHLDLCWLPPDLFTSRAPAALKDRMPYVTEGPKGPMWVTKKGGTFGLANGMGSAGREYVPGQIHRSDRMASTGLYEDGIARERAYTAPLRSAAESVLDTTDFTPVELRDELRRRFGGDADQPVLTIASFGFARGVSRTADLMFDLRFISNPHWIDELRPLTGEDAPVRAYLDEDPAWATAMDRIEALLIDWIPRYWAAGKSYVTVAFGCTGGRHRSVAAAVEMAERLRKAGFSPNVRHRDMLTRSLLDEMPAEAS